MSLLLQTQAISATTLALTLAILTAGVLVALVALGLSNLVLCRMALRNMVRRPSQTLILVLGLALSTMVITSSFGLSDSFADSTISYRLAALGNVDESVTGPFTQAQVNTALARIRQSPDVQAATALTLDNQGIDLSLIPSGLRIPDVIVYAVPAAFDQVYGPLTSISGAPLHFSDLQSNDVFLSAAIAQDYDVHPGDTINILTEVGPKTGRVRAILANNPAVTTGEAVDGGEPALVMSLAYYQQILPSVPNTICIKNIGAGGLDDIGPGGSRSQAVISLLQSLFPGAPLSLHAPHALGLTDFSAARIHPLKPDLVERVESLPINKLVAFSSAGQQFTQLPPLFALLLLGAGMLLLVLLLILLAAERRPELGMSRALGLQRRHLIQLLVMEGCGYGVIASLLGVALGLGATLVEIGLLSHLPQLSPGEFGNQTAVPVTIPLHPWLSWQSALGAWAIGVLATILIVLFTSIWISRTTIVTAIRDLDDPVPQREKLARLARMLWSAPRDTSGKPLPETSARRRARFMDALSGLLWGLWARGPLSLLAGLLLLLVARQQGQDWLQLLGLAVLIGGVGCLLNWLLLSVGLRAALARRLGFSLMGLGWLILGALPGSPFLTLFQPLESAAPPTSALELLLNMLLPVVGLVVLLITNADLLVALVTPLLQRIRGLRSISRTGLAYLLTFRFRTGVTMALLGLITFLVLLLVTTNLGSIQEAQAAAKSGGFQLEVDLFNQDYRDLANRMQDIQDQQILGQDFSTVGRLRPLHQLPTSSQAETSSILLHLPGEAAPKAYDGIATVADDIYLSETELHLLARASGYTSDQQVWNAVKDAQNDVVLRYDPNLKGWPLNNGFAPFTAEVPDSIDANAHYHLVTVIGILPASTQGDALFLSTRTAATIVPTPFIGVNFYLFRLRSGVSESKAAQDLSGAIQSKERGIPVQSLDNAGLNGVTAVFTIFLGGYLALGLLFGALALGVILSRAVVERRQQIGMLRALGFSRPLVRRSFLLEAGAVILLGLLIGISLALWLSYQVARESYANFPLPLGALALILLGSILVALVSTIVPARRASLLPPAEALRYE